WLELGGKSVSSDAQEFRKQLGEIKANSPVDAVVLRKGKKESVKGISLPEAKNEAGFGLPGVDFGGLGIPNLPEFPVPPRIPNGPNNRVPRPIMPGVGFQNLAPGMKGMSPQVAY